MSSAITHCIPSAEVSVPAIKRSWHNSKIQCDQTGNDGRGGARGGGRGAAPPHPPKKKTLSLSLILIKNPNLIFSFDRNNNLDQSNTSIWTIFLIL